MKRLKYAHLFNGKQYPLIISSILALVAPLFALKIYPSVHPVILMIVCILIGTFISIVIARHLSPAEREIISETPKPVWYPIDDYVRDRITEKYYKTQYSMMKIIISCTVIYSVIMLISIIMQKDGSFDERMKTVLPIAVIMAVIAFVAIILRKGRGKFWLEVDDSAMYTVIPVHHCYDVTYHSKTGNFYTHYLVFYQPDGRYVLKIPDTVVGCTAVIIVKYRRDITWIPVSGLESEGFL